MSSVSDDSGHQPLDNDGGTIGGFLKANPQGEVDEQANRDEESHDNAADNQSNKNDEVNENNKDDNNSPPIEPDHETPLHQFLRSLEVADNDNASVSVGDEAVDAAVGIPDDAHHDNTRDVNLGNLAETIANDEVVDTHAADTATGNVAVPVEGDNLPVDLEKDLSLYVNVRSPIPPGQTPLHIAVDKGHTKIIIRLLDEGADINAMDYNNVRPLHVAVDNKNSSLIELLLDRGAVTSGPDLDKWTLLHYASSYEQNPDIFQRLLALDHQYINQEEDFTRWTPLNRATWYGQPSVIIPLLKAGADLSIPDKDGWTPLMTAVKQKHFTIFDQLTDHIIESELQSIFYQVDHQGTSILMALCSVEEDSVPQAMASLDKLLHKGPELIPYLQFNYADRRGQTPLHHVMRSVHRHFSTDIKRMALAIMEHMKEEVLLDRDFSNLTAFDEEIFRFSPADSHSTSSSDNNSDSDSDSSSNSISSSATDNVDINKYHGGSVAGSRVASETRVSGGDDDGARIRVAKQGVRDLLDVAIKRLKGSPVFRNDLLCWLVSREPSVDPLNFHRIAIDILSELGTPETMKGLPPPEEWNLVDWVIYHRLPQVLLDCKSIQSAHGEDQKDSKQVKANGKAMIVQLRRRLKADASVTKPKELQPATEPGRGRKREDALPIPDKPPDIKAQRRLLEEMEDILDFTHVERTQRVKESLKLTKLGKEMEESARDFNAAVVAISGDDNEFSRASKFRSVDDIVYGDSEIKTIRDTVNTVKRTVFRPSMDMIMRADQRDQGSSFTWVHLPSTNMTWMMDTMRKVLNPSQSAQFPPNHEQIALFLRGSWAQIPDDTSLSRFMRPRYVKMNGQENAAPFDVPQGYAQVEDGITQNENERDISIDLSRPPPTALYMPFLVADYHEKRDVPDSSSPEKTTTLGGQSSLQAASRPAKPPVNLSKREKLFEAYREYVIHDSPTLDEHYYHFASDEKSNSDQFSRNHTQVVTKYLYPDLSPEALDAIGSWRVLRVSQLWAWAIGDKWIITATSCAKVEKESAFVNDILDHLRHRVNDGKHGRMPRSPSELSKIIVEYCIGNYGRHQKFDDLIPPQPRPNDAVNVPNSVQNKSESPTTKNRAKLGVMRSQERSIRQIFSDSINTIGRQEAELFGDFSARGRGGHRDGEPHTIANVQEATRKAATLLFEIKDIRDELNILKTIAEYQRKVQSSIDGDVSSSGSAPNAASMAVDEDLSGRYVKNDVEELDRLARKTEDALHTTITLYESEIGNLQAGIANQQAKEAADQGKRVMVFTVVTVWFRKPVNKTGLQRDLVEEDADFQKGFAEDCP
ncbi:hypothetical protein CcaCcLH18_10466 [Colletotrichum camelliae]|nr:hypothetical protein CcaCcLH18_10466 [Colletotrichum camelliae]